MRQHEAEQLAVKYLKLRGCGFSGERIGNIGMLKFSMPDQTAETGRLMVRNNNQVEVWNTASTKPLALESPWIDGASKTIGTRKIPVKAVPAQDLMLALNGEHDQSIKPLAIMQAAHQPSPIEVFSDAAVESAARHSLAAEGWTFARQLPNGITECNDGAGRRNSCRMIVKNGIASVWSYRGDLVLAAPWQPGCETKDGCQTMYATGRTLGLDRDQAVSASNYVHAVPRQTERPALNPATVDFVRRVWGDGVPAPADHPVLNKYGAKLDPDGLCIIAESGTARKQYAVGNLLVPLYRPDAEGRQLELAGGQRLLQKPFNDSDKYFLAGTPASGVMALIPPPRDLDNGLNDWLDKANFDQPLIFAESVAAGMALHQTGAGNVICALSAKNLPVVAKWIESSGIVDGFPAGVIVAADNDHERTQSGNLKSSGILNALQAAEILDAKVALANYGKHGMDARDLLAEGGELAIYDYMANCRSPNEIRQQRTDIFPGDAIKDQVAAARQISPESHMER